MSEVTEDAPVEVPRKPLWRRALVALFVGAAAFVLLVFLLAWLNVSRLDDRALQDALNRPVLLAWLDHGEGGTRVIVDGCVCDRTLRDDELSEVVKSALIATEDRRFYDHLGIDARGIGRALAVNAWRIAQSMTDGRRRSLEGGSTLTQQLAKVTLTGAEKGLPRKAAEAILTLRLEALYDKDDLLRLYLSRVEFGRIRGIPIHGLRDAARVYFGRAPQDLTIEQAAILVGLVNGTTIYHPIRNPDNAAARATLVIDRMRSAGLLPREPAGPLRFHLPKSHVEIPLRHRYVEDLLAAEFLQAATARSMPEGFYRVVSSIDAVAQFRALQFTVEEVARVASLDVARGTLVTLDPEGRILALVGDVNYRLSSFNIATQGERQAASTAKIATYLAALEAGWGPDDIVQDDPTSLSGPFRPRNDDRSYRGAIPLERCFRESRNVCTYWLAEQVGFDAVSDMAHRIGLTATRAPGPSVVLGAVETTPVRMAAAFAALANGGTLTEPRVMAYAIGPYASLRYDGPPPARSLGLKPETVTRIRRLLRQVITDGTGRRAAFVGADSFGKTGTSQRNRDAWFAGFTTDDITTVVWVGPEEGGRMRGVSGGTVPARIYARFNLSLVDRFHGYKTGGELSR